MGQKLTYDPTPGAEPWVPYATGKATTAGSTGGTVTVEFMGRTYPGCRALGTIAAGAMVSLVVARGTSWAIELAGQIPTSIPRRLDGWGAKKPASIALRQLLEGNPRRYKYQPVRVLGAGAVAGTAQCTFPDGRTSDCRAEWGGEIVDAATDAGMALARRVGNEYRLVGDEWETRPLSEWNHVRGDNLQSPFILAGSGESREIGCRGVYPRFRVPTVVRLELYNTICLYSPLEISGAVLASYADYPTEGYYVERVELWSAYASQVSWPGYGFVVHSFVEKLAESSVVASEYEAHDGSYVRYNDDPATLPPDVPYLPGLVEEYDLMPMACDAYWFPKYQIIGPTRTFEASFPGTYRVQLPAIADLSAGLAFKIFTTTLLPLAWGGFPAGSPDPAYRWSGKYLPGVSVL